MSIAKESDDQAIRLFLYVDAYKLNSISAQLFSGLTDQIVQQRRTGKSESETQKGEFASGRSLADETSDESLREERRVIHDFAYTALERDLSTRGKLLTITPSQPCSVDEIDHSSFVRVVGPTSFLDLESLSEFMAEFNKFGEAMTYTTTLQEREQSASELRKQLAETRDRNAKERLNAQLRVLSNVQALAQERGLHHDPKNLEAVAYLLRRGLGDHFELQISHASPEPRLFSAVLRREYLRESERAIVKKYGRDAQLEFTMVGSVSQRGGKQRPKRPDLEIKHLRDAIQNLATHMRAIEDTFFVPYDHEIVIDPIAVYLSL
jgi:hypothetical protein